MTDAIVTIQGDYFDIVEPTGHRNLDTSISTYINMMLFTKPWWANPDAGSELEIQTDGINTKEPLKNIEIVLANVKRTLIRENLVSEFSFEVDINAEDSLLKFQWKAIDLSLCTKMEMKINGITRT